MTDKKYKAIVVNDNALQRRIISEFLIKERLEVTGYKDAESAIDSMNSSDPPHIIISDLNMPGIDGWRFCRLLRSKEYEQFNKVPIIIVSATFAGENIEKISRDIGANAFLPSPVDAKDLINKVKKLISGDTQQVFSKVLIIDDSAMVIEMLTKAFANHGYKTDAVKTISEGIEFFEHSQYTAVIIDYHLPDGNGDSLIEKFRKQKPECACIMITTDPNPDLAVSWMKKGAAAYVHKPFDPEYLIEICGKVIREQSMLRVVDLLEERTRELRESEERHRRITENTSSMIFRMSLPEGKYEYISSSVMKMIGYSQEDFYKNPKFVERIIHPDFYDFFRTEWINLVKGNPPSYYEFKILSGTGEVKWLNQRNLVIRDEKGFPIAIEGIVVDITEQKYSEKKALIEKELNNALNRSASLYDSLESCLSAAIEISDMDSGGIYLMNDRGGADLFCNKGLSEDFLLYAKHYDKNSDNIKLIKKGKPIYIQTNTTGLDIDILRLREGLTCIAVIPVKQNDEVVACLNTASHSCLEISKNTQAQLENIAMKIASAIQKSKTEEILRDREERLKTVARNLPGVIYQFYADNDGKYGMNFVSERAKEVFGLSLNLDTFFASFVEHIPAEERENFIESIRKVVASATPWNYEGHFIKDNGEVIWFQGMSTPSKTQKKVIFNGILLDITERKKAEQALYESNLLLKATQKLARIGSWKANPHTQYLEWTEGVYDIIEEPLTLKPDMNEGFNYYLPKYIPILKEKLAQCLKDGTSFALETEIVSAKGKKLWCEVRGIASVTETSRSYAIGTIQDITEHKLEEETALRRQESLKRYNDTIFSLMKEGAIFSGDFKKAICIINEACTKLLNIERVSVWLYSDNYSKITCSDLYLLSKHQHISGEMLNSADFPNYTKSHLEGKIICAIDVSTDPRTKDIPNSYYKNNNILSLMDSPIWIENRIGGIFSFEQTKTYRVWTEDEERFASMMTNLISLSYEIAERKQTEIALRNSEEMFRTIFDLAPYGISITDLDGRYLAVNSFLSELENLSPEQIIGFTPHEKPELFKIKDPEHSTLFHNKLLKDKEIRNERTTIFRESDNKKLDILFSSKLIDILGENRVISIVLDLTDMKRLEDQLEQARKLEAVGLLAGGIAHDLNNMLSPILGYSELIMEDIAEENPLKSDVAEIILAAQKARDLVRQLLAFARKQIIEMRVLNINKVISEFIKMLKRTLRENINIDFLPADNPGTMKGDIGQIEQIILNLSINSQDAMPNGGFLTIETSKVSLDEEYAKNHEDVVPGSYIMMSLSDTGTGMDKETLTKIFDPFFTTKEKGKGTGLGLATVYGIVKQHGGSISVDSIIGKGTTFRIYFPETDERGESKEPFQKPQLPKGIETILVVEDQQQVRDMVCNILKRQGYNVVCANNGEAAMKFAKEYKEPIHLLISDVIMTGMNGQELHHKLSGILPDLKVLFMSGYTSDVIGHHGVLDEGMKFISKPFSLQTLATKVRELLDTK